MSEKESRYYKAYMEQNTVSRRGLFRALTSGAKRSINESPNKTHIPGIGDIEHVERKVARPPKAVDEVLFQQVCNGCGECATACPEQVIVLEHDLAQLNFDYGYCSQCGNCSSVCPTGALHGIQTDVQMRPMFRTSCQNAIVGDCQLCQQLCPTRAVTIENFELPTFDSSKCDGCGRCGQGCPFSAIEMQFAANTPI
ncbi:4Fe-4S binding protein [Vibrio agarivorans]|uniref:4Fe-4S binding protein n=1 Tax=Vibrio agarivorans TaxID=153622 RepID=UPI0022321236|nr:4Fe-4S binding protein [Vibrio agarivorans]MDN3659923.1 4Fe-4S binding protein [Vibrio agarivorans]